MGRVKTRHLAMDELCIAYQATKSQRQCEPERTKAFLPSERTHPAYTWSPSYCRGCILLTLWCPSTKERKMPSISLQDEVLYVGV